MSLFPRIKTTLDRKGIRQKTHYSEPTPEAITRRQRRKHNRRPSTLPPCPNDMDLMIEAKDKEQAVFEMMRTFKLPGWDSFNDIIPYERSDDNKLLPKKVKKKKQKKQIAEEIEYGKELSEEEIVKDQIPDQEIGMGGPENRVYWPPGMEEWLRPKKREVKKKGGEDEEDIFKNPTPANFAARKAVMGRNKAPLSEAMREKLSVVGCVTDVQKVLDEIRGEAEAIEAAEGQNERPSKKVRTTPVKKATSAKKKTARSVQTPGTSNMEDEEEDLSMPDLSTEDDETRVVTQAVAPARQSVKATGKRKSYVEDNSDFSEAE